MDYFRREPLTCRDADPHHFNADPDPDPAFHFKTDLDPAYHFNADPDPAPRQSDMICDHCSIDLVKVI